MTYAYIHIINTYITPSQNWLTCYVLQDIHLRMYKKCILYIYNICNLFAIQKDKTPMLSISVQISNSKWKNILFMNVPYIMNQTLLSVMWKHLEERFPRYYMHSAMVNMFKPSIILSEWLNHGLPIFTLAQFIDK